MPLTYDRRLVGRPGPPRRRSGWPPHAAIRLAAPAPIRLAASEVSAETPGLRPAAIRLAAPVAIRLAALSPIRLAASTRIR